MNGDEAARAWVHAWEQGWPAHDPGVIAARYADDAVFRSHPFREPADARSYVARVLAEEDDEPEVWFGAPIVSGDRAAVEYWAVVSSEGREQTLAGTTVLRFDQDGLAIEHRDYWAIEEGRRQRPSTEDTP